MVDRGGDLSLSRRCELLGVSRSSQYYEPLGESAENLALMRRLDELHLEHPFYGSRQMTRHLRRERVVAGRHRVRQLMWPMGMEAVYRRPRTSAANPGAPDVPVPVARPRDRLAGPGDQVWCADTTYIPVSQGFFYLVAAMDWASRHVLSWRLSNMMERERALPRGAYPPCCARASVGDCFDNALCESFFATLECERIERRTFQTRDAARLAVFNRKPRHSALGYVSPAVFERAAEQEAA